jgi:ribonuclease HI
MSRKSNQPKFYVVWHGTKPGIYKTWAECQSATSVFTNAKFKSFPTLRAAETAFREGPGAYWGTKTPVTPLGRLTDEELIALDVPVAGSLCVDAAWDAMNKDMEYRGVWFDDRSEAFHQGPFPRGTNNIGEYLAIVHALAILTKAGSGAAIFSDSHTAIVWVRQKRANSASIAKGETSDQVNDLVDRANNWLRANNYSNEILKWNTSEWGEIPADFGRK